MPSNSSPTPKPTFVYAATAPTTPSTPITLLCRRWSFSDAESFYATVAHECCHWTRHPSRLDRELGRKKYGDEGYAREELVAELGAAFLCCDLELTPVIREDHASYIASWLEELKNDKRAIFQAASHAQRAVDYLHSLQPQQQEAAA
jgi:antirestriction protein ArdC